MSKAQKMSPNEKIGINKEENEKESKDFLLGKGEDEEEEEEEEVEEDSTKTFTTFYKPRAFSTVPSHGSFYTEFYPFDLNQFKTERIRSENATPICMTSAWRVISFFFVVFILPTLLISIPLYARYHIYHAKNHYFTDGDMKSFHKDVSSFWCQGQRLISNGTFEAFLTKEARRSRKRRISKLSSNVLLQYDEIEEWGVHLIKGSHFKFSACSRWPGGTLLVVQGEENLRRCFYREERFYEGMKEVKKTEVQKTLFELKKQTEVRGEEKGAAEIIEEGDEEILSQRDIIRKLYSSSRLINNQKNIDNNHNSKNNFKTSVEQHSSNYSLKSEISSNLDDNEKPTRKIKNKKERKKKRKRLNKLKERTTGKNKVNNTTTLKAIHKRSITSQPYDKAKQTHSVKVDGGSLFFNVNDTLDVTTGNSSFSSSEEFLRQCSDTIISIDLSPFPDCSQRTSNFNDTSMTWKFRVNESDFHYFIFTSDNSLETNVISFDILLERKLYNVSDYLQKCSNTSECVLPFSFMKSEGVIIDFKEHYENVTNMNDLNNYEVTAICQPRTLVYTIFILCVPFIIVLFAFR
ncbi:UNVERIFIED_CONTAM: hypothetical protein RMT77_017029 [Armadillidium vulgare]